MGDSQQIRNWARVVSVTGADSVSSFMLCSMVFFLFNFLFGGAGGGGGVPSFLGELRWDARAPAMAAAPDIFWVDQERNDGTTKILKLQLCVGVSAIRDLF